MHEKGFWNTKAGTVLIVMGMLLALAGSICILICGGTMDPKAGAVQAIGWATELVAAIAYVALWIWALGTGVKEHLTEKDEDC